MQPPPARRIAMWSGPRNLSTALLRSFGNRADCFVSDEPLYAHYLSKTAKDHPGRDEVLRHHDADAARVTAWLTGPVPEGRPLWYQKHMTHHLLPSVGREWLESLEHVFLIRAPKAVLASLLQIYPAAGLEDTGLAQQVALFRDERDRRGRTPPVLDANDLAARPEAMLRALCRRLDLDFDPAMLRWAPGPRPTDGVWAKHWYGALLESTGFQPLREAGDVTLPARATGLLAACEDLHAELDAARLRPEDA